LQCPDVSEPRAIILDEDMANLAVGHRDEKSGIGPSLDAVDDRQRRHFFPLFSTDSMCILN
jgi:hypothetical protein